MFPSPGYGDASIQYEIARLANSLGIDPQAIYDYYSQGSIGLDDDGTPMLEEPPPDETIPPPPGETLPPPGETPPPPGEDVTAPGFIAPFWSSRNKFWDARFNPPRAPNYAGAPIFHNDEGDDIDKMAANDRLLAIGRGDELNADYRDFQHYYFGQAADYEMWLAGAYQEILQGRGGYSPEEQDKILREAELYGLNMQPWEYDANYLQDWEYGGIRGAPEEMINRLQEGMAAQDQILTDSTARRREALYAQDERMRGRQGDQEGRLRAGLDWQDAALRNAMQIEEGDIYGGLDWQEGMLGGMLGEQEDAIRGLYRDQAGRLRDAFGNLATGVRGALAEGEFGARSQIDPRALSLSDEFQRDYRFGPEDEQRLVDQAGRSVQASRQATEDEIERRMAAQGNVNPAAYSAMMNRARLTGEVNQADAMTDARVRARETALNTTLQREQERLDAERFSQGLRSNLELTLGGRRLQGELGIGQAGLGAEEYLTGAGLGAEEYLGSSGLDTGRYLGGSRLDATAGLGGARRGTEQYLGGSRLNTEQYLGGSGLDTERYLGGSRLGTEGEIGSDWLRSQMQLTPLAVDTQGRVDAAQRGAAQWLAANRQDTERYNQGQRYSRGLSIYDRASGANQMFANQRLNELAEYRAFLSEMQKRAGAQSTEAGRLRLGTFGTQIGGQEGATRNMITNYGTPGMGERIAKIVTAPINLGVQWNK